MSRYSSFKIGKLQNMAPAIASVGGIERRVENGDSIYFHIDKDQQAHVSVYATGESAVLELGTENKIDVTKRKPRQTAVFYYDGEWPEKGPRERIEKHAELKLVD